MTDEPKPNRGGRPRKHPVGPRTNLTVRLPTEMRDGLSDLAKGKGRSLAEEIEWRLAESMEIDELFGGTDTARIGRLIALGIHAAGEGKHWRDDEETRLRCRGVAIGIINVLMGGPPNRLTATAGDPALARKVARAAEDAVEIAADTVQAELERMAARPPAVRPPERQRVIDELKAAPTE